ncbi:MAG: NupC/NupG family nucleoside CNT transporter [Mangrovibacterium sp.]
MRKYVFRPLLLIGLVTALTCSFASALPLNTIPKGKDTVETHFAAGRANLLLSHPEPHGFSLKSLGKGLAGMLILLGLGFLISTDRGNIPWKTVGSGLAFQLILALGILYVSPVQAVFEFFGQVFVKILDFTKAGTGFLFGSLIDMEQYGSIFAFQILPTMIFFSALTSMLFYWGILQKIVRALSWLFRRLMKISGAESLAVAGNIFIGQIEAPLLIKAYLPLMNASEIMLVMTGGMATMAGGVLAAYIGMLGGNDPLLRLEFAKHLLAASVMAAPGAVIFAKMLVPNSGPVTRETTISRRKFGNNLLDAITNGTSDGIKLALNVAGMLLAFLALIAMVNFGFEKIGAWTGLNRLIEQSTGGRFDELSLQFLLGYLFAPLMWLIGIHPQDIMLVGRLLGEKLILTEFIGYISLSDLKAAGAFLEYKSVIMATYVLCGFANFASIGMQIGGIGALAPKQRATLSKYGIPSVIAGTLASLMSATIIGMLLS